MIGMNRALIAMQDDETANYQDPYSAAKSITVLNGHMIQGVHEADTIAESIGLADARILVDEENLNIRYSVSESTEELKIVQALICTRTKSFPPQFFFNGIANTDVEAAVCDILLSIRPADFYAEVIDEQSVPAETIVPVPVETLVESVPMTPLVQPPVVSEAAEGRPYAPGKEPLELRVRVERFFVKLECYPLSAVANSPKIC